MVIEWEKKGRKKKKNHNTLCLHGLQKILIKI